MPGRVGLRRRTWPRSRQRPPRVAWSSWASTSATTPRPARAFVRKYQITFPSFDDQNGLVLAQFNGIIPVSAVPSTLVVDREGAIRARVVGTVDATTLRGLIEDAEQIG